MGPEPGESPEIPVVADWFSRASFAMGATIISLAEPRLTLDLKDRPVMPTNPQVTGLGVSRLKVAPALDDALVAAELWCWRKVNSASVSRTAMTMQATNMLTQVVGPGICRVGRGDASGQCGYWGPQFVDGALGLGEALLIYGLCSTNRL